MTYQGDQYTLNYSLSYNEETGQFDTSGRYEYKLNSNNDFIKYELIAYEDGEWVNRSKDSFIYDQSKHLTKQLKFMFWDADQNKYLPPRSIVTFVNNSNGNPIITYSLRRNTFTQEIDTVSKTFHKYNSDQNVIMDSIFRKNNGEYELNAKRIHTYDASGLNTKWESFQWDTDSSKWDLRNYYTYEKSEDKRRIMENSYSINKSTNKWRNSNRTIYYLRGTNAIDQKRTLPFKIYPNPGTGKFTIALDAQEELAYQVTNTMGQTIKQGFVSAQSNQIDLTTFNKGVYFIQIYNGSHMGTQKVIVE